MARFTVVLGLVLVVLGLAAYLGTGRESITALIPAFFGVPLAILGVVGRAEQRRKHAMHVATLIALLGLLGSARGLLAALSLALGDEVARPTAAVVQAIMAVLCLVFVIAAVRSFIQARRARAE